MQYVKNEWIKLWAQKKSWAILFIMLLIIVSNVALTKYFDEPQNTKEDRIEANKAIIAEYEALLMEENIREADASLYEGEILKAEHRIENNYRTDSAVTFSSFMESSNMFITTFISIFTVVIAAGIVSTEFSTGTIKMLLTRPVARWKILLSKLVTTILYGVTLLVIGLGLSAIAGVVLFGTDSSPVLELVNGAVIEQETVSSFFKTLCFSSASTLMTILFAFMLGSIFGSSTIAVALSLFVLFMGTTISIFIAKYDFAKYIFFANDLSQFSSGNTPIIPDLTVGFAVGVNIIYAIVFLVITFSYFTKRDITA